MTERIKSPRMMTGESFIKQKDVETLNTQEDINFLLQELGVHTESELKPATVAIITAGSEITPPPLQLLLKRG